jgi:aerobic-type carbon monoxide dehydrogenase small subunit (CoxS/CutS family)
MPDREICAFDLNGKPTRVEADAGATLLSVLRDDLRVLSPKRGCNQGVCGSCTVMIDDRPQRACLTLAAGCAGKQVKTIEGFTGDAVMDALQRSMIVSGGVQCGFCTSGVLISAQSLLNENIAPSVDEIRAALSGNLCRCTGYRRIVEAVVSAAAELAA